MGQRAGERDDVVLAEGLQNYGALRDGSDEDTGIAAVAPDSRPIENTSDEGMNGRELLHTSVGLLLTTFSLFMWIEKW